MECTLTASEFRKFLKGTPAAFVGLGENGESHKHLVGVKPRVVASEIFGLRFLNRLYHLLRNQLHAVVDSGKMLCGVKNQRRARTESNSEVSEVMIVPSASSIAAHGLPQRSRLSLAATVTARRVGVDSRLIEEQPYFLDLVSIVGTAHKFVCGVVIATDYLVAACIAAHFIVVDAEAETMLTPISVGDLYGFSPYIPSNSALSTGKISMSRL